jgi:hypothetical protein
MSSPRRYQQAYTALNAFYRRLVSDLADKILEQESSLGETYLGIGEEIVERYGHQLLLTQHALMGLGQAMEGGNLRPPEPRVRSLSCPEDEIEDRMNEWLGSNPDAELLNFQVLPGEDECRLLLLYNSHRPAG